MWKKLALFVNPWGLLGQFVAWEKQTHVLGEILTTENIGSSEGNCFSSLQGTRWQQQQLSSLGCMLPSAAWQYQAN